MLELNLTENTNSTLQANGYNPQGKYYARVETKQTYDMKKLAKHMHQHNTAFSTGLIVGVLTDMACQYQTLGYNLLKPHPSSPNASGTHHNSQMGNNTLMTYYC